MNSRRFWTAAVVLMATGILLAGCGGGSGAAPPPPSNPLTITTTSLPDATQGQAYNFTLQATGGSGARTWSITVGTLPGGLSLDGTTGTISGTPTVSGPFNFTAQVRDAAAHSDTQGLSLNVQAPPPPVVTTTALPNAKRNSRYVVFLSVSGQVMQTGWSLAPGSGALPAGLVLDAGGQLSGTPTAAGTTNFTVRFLDSLGRTADGGLSLTVVDAPGRNDSIATATPLSNGSFRASISPFTGGSGPDSDYYKVTANPGTVVTVEIFAQRPHSLPATSTLDSVIEIVNASGVRFSTCRDPGNDNPPAPAIADATPTAFDDSCINDDIDLGVITDSRLELQVPGSSGGPPVTFYVHVLDFRGDARPDLLYDIQISGAI